MEQNQQSLLLGKIAAYTEILVKDPNSTIFVSLAETYRKMGMFEDARQIIVKGLDLHPDVSPAYIVLARILCQLGDLSGSVATFEQALELDPENLSALVGYARVQILLGDEMAARKILLKARSLSSADPIINKLLLSLPQENEIDEESTAAQSGQIDDIEENSPPLVSSTLAELYLVQGLTSKALDIFQRLSVQNPDDLFFRRKIKELEAQLDEEKQPGAEIPDDIKSDQKDDVSQNVVEVMETPLQQPTELKTELTGSVPSHGLKEEQILSTLNFWLSNIQQRRRNV